MQIKLKGSKSITNRALALSYLAKTRLLNIGECEDTLYMKAGLSRLRKAKPGRLFLGNAGTAVRFLTSLAATSNKQVTITGSKRMHERPIKQLTDALTKLGAKLEPSQTGCPPINIQPSTLKGGTVEIPGNISSQYITSLLLVSPLMEKGLTIRIKGELTSKPYVEMTIKLLEKFNVKTTTTKTFSTIKVKSGQKLKAPKSGSLFIEGDASSASYLGAYSALNPTKPVTIKNIPKKSIQGDLEFTNHLHKMGCKISHKENTIQIQGPETLKGLGTVDMNTTPDLVMTFAILATVTPGTTRLTNIANLRIKECDRLKALKTELEKLETKVTTGKDYIKIKGEPLEDFIARNHHKKISINTYDDHRIAMAFGVLKKTILPNLKIKTPHIVRKSYPEFWSDLNKLNRNK
jgi:3-phosphoshikimate 1-carboxyvinyltransferase